MSDVRERMQETGRMVQTILPPNTGFVLLAFDFGPGGRLEYVANADRKDIVNAMREWITKTEDGFGTHIPDPLGAIGELTKEQREHIIQCADSVEAFLGRNAGCSADWPIDIRVDNQKAADELSSLLGSLNKALKPYRAIAARAHR